MKNHNPCSTLPSMAYGKLMRGHCCNAAPKKGSEDLQLCYNEKDCKVVLPPGKFQGFDEWRRHIKRAPLAKRFMWLMMWVEIGGTTAITATILVYALGSALENIQSWNALLLLLLQACSRFLFFELHTRKQSVKHINLIHKLPLLKTNPISVFSPYLHPCQARRYKLVCWFLEDIRSSRYRFKEAGGLLCTSTGKCLLPPV